MQVRNTYYQLDGKGGRHDARQKYNSFTVLQTLT